MMNGPTWERCEVFLKENQPSTVKWLPLIRDGHLDWMASERVMDEGGTMSEASNVPIAISMAPMDLASFDANAWQERLGQLKVLYPALGVVGLKKARKLMEENPGTAVQFDSASGFVSSIGVNIVAYKEAEAAGWNPNNGRIKERRSGKRKGPPSTPTEDMPALMPPSQPMMQPVSSLAIATAIPMGMPAAFPVSSSVSMPHQPPHHRAPQKNHEALDRRDPPSEVHKLLRTAARIPPLVKYLRSNGHFNYMNEGQWRCIRKWCETAEGMAWLKTAGLDPLSYHLHHVKAKESGGHYSVYNCVFAPGSANGWWGKTDSAHMREYIGDEAAKLSDRHAKWCAVQAAKGIDQSKFNPDFD